MKKIIFIFAVIAIVSTLFVACAPLDNNEQDETTITETTVETETTSETENVETDVIETTVESETTEYVPSPERTTD